LHVGQASFWARTIEVNAKISIARIKNLFIPPPQCHAVGNSGTFAGKLYPTLDDVNGSGVVLY
jgi:hypothetical protein